MSRKYGIIHWIQYLRWWWVDDWGLKGNNVPTASSTMFWKQSPLDENNLWSVLHLSAPAFIAPKTVFQENCDGTLFLALNWFYILSQMPSLINAGNLCHSLQREVPPHRRPGRLERDSTRAWGGEEVHVMLDSKKVDDHRLCFFQGAPCTAIREVSLLKDLKHANIGELTELLKRQEYTWSRVVLVHVIGRRLWGLFNHLLMKHHHPMAAPRTCNPLASAFYLYAVLHGSIIDPSPEMKWNKKAIKKVGKVTPES